MRHWYRYILLLITLPGYAQVQSTQGWFEVDYQQGCFPLEVSVRTNIPESDVPIFQFNGRDDPNQVPWLDSYDSLTHTYTTAGSYMIYLTVQNATPVRSDSIEITVLNSISPTFTLINCINNGVSVNISDTFYDSYLIDYGDGTVESVPGPVPSPSHFYATSGSFNVTVTGRLTNAPNNCGSQSQTISVTPTLLPPVLHTVRSDTLEQMDLTFTLPQQANYQLEVAAGNDQNFQFYQSLQATDTVTITNFTPSSNRFCFRIAAVNACGGGVSYSNVVCSIQSSLQVQNNQMVLNWAHVSTGDENQYRISRNTVVDFITIPAGGFSFTDDQVDCGTTYCYQVTTLYSNGSHSTSPTVCGIAFSNDTPPIVANLGVSVTQDAILISWDNDPQIDTSYLSQFTVDGTLITRDTTTVNIRSIATDLQTYPQTCYTHTYRDVCTNINQPGTPVCSIWLTTQSNDDGSVTLNWTEYLGFADSIASYALLKYDQNGMLLESIDVGNVLTYDDQISGTNDQIVRYVIEATPNDAAFQPIHSNTVEAARRVQLHFPTAFTPNGDGLNDKFKPEYRFVKTYDLKVYSRWGQVMFATTDLDEGWDGTFDGKKVPAEGYTYVANGEDFQGVPIARSGIVTILKN